MEDSTADPALAPESTTDESRVNLESAEPFSTTSIKSEQLASEERPNCTQPNLSPKELEENVRGFLTSATAHEFTKRRIREKLAENFDVSIETIDIFKTEINTIVQKIVAEITDKMGEPVKPKEAMDEPNERTKRQAERTPTSGRAKRVKVESELTDEGESEEGSECSDEGSSAEDVPKKKGKAKARAGVKAAQSNIMTRNAFLKNATSYDCRIGDLEFKLEPREFKTRSCGWFFGGKFPFRIGEHEVTCSVGLNCTVVGSKMWSDGKKKK